VSWVDEAKKQCIFCGEIPRDCTEEHIVPRWLVKLTGPPKRKGKLHHPLGQSVPYERSVARACKRCNKRYERVLETPVSAAIRSIVDTRCVDFASVHLIMDWIDKLRWGNWILGLIHTGNPFRIAPTSMIDGFVGRWEQLLWIFATPEPCLRLVTLGSTYDYFYLQYPHVFGMFVNGVAFISHSEVLCCQRLLPNIPRYQICGFDAVSESMTVKSTDQLSTDYSRRWPLWFKDALVFARPRYAESNPYPPDADGISRIRQVFGNDQPLFVGPVPFGSENMFWPANAPVWGRGIPVQSPNLYDRHACMHALYKRFFRVSEYAVRRHLFRPDSSRRWRRRQMIQAARERRRLFTQMTRDDFIRYDVDGAARRHLPKSVLPKSYVEAKGMRLD
jgi:hypothetical protein